MPTKSTPKAKQKPATTELRKSLEIFRTGEHTSSSGEKLAFDEAALVASIGAYDKDLHEAPIVLGHPSSDAPAYGWVQSLSLKGGAMVAEVGQLEAQFVEAVKAGRYKKVSASFYKPDSPANPKPGVYYLRHVGFLGARPPAVKGLATHDFSERDDCVSFASSDPLALLRTEGSTTPAPSDDFAEFDVDAAIARVRSSVEAMLPEGIAAADREKLLEAIATASRTELEAAGSSAREASPTVDHEEQQEDEAAARRRSQRERDLARREAALREREHVAFLEQLERGGRRMPASRAELLALFRVLDGESAPVSFGEGKQARTPTWLFRALLGRMPEVAFGEHGAPGEGDEDGDREPTAAEVAAFQEQQIKAGTFTSTSAAVNELKAKRAKR